MLYNMQTKPRRFTESSVIKPSSYKGEISAKNGDKMRPSGSFQHIIKQPLTQAPEDVRSYLHETKNPMDINITKCTDQKLRSFAGISQVCLAGKVQFMYTYLRPDSCKKQQDVAKDQIYCKTIFKESYFCRIPLTSGF